jgi:hypothetical protein
MIMAMNHKLTGVLKDRIVQSMKVNASEVSIEFFERFHNEDKNHGIEQSATSGESSHSDNF